MHFQHDVLFLRLANKNFRAEAEAEAGAEASTAAATAASADNKFAHRSQIFNPTSKLDTFLTPKPVSHLLAYDRHHILFLQNLTLLFITSLHSLS